MEESHLEVLHELPSAVATELFLNVAGRIESQEVYDLLKLQNPLPLLNLKNWGSIS